MAKVNRVEVSAGEAPLPQWSKRLKIFALKVLARLGKDQWDLTVLLCNDETISDLNSRFRGKDEATDILSFNMGKGGGRGGSAGVLCYATLLYQWRRSRKTPPVLRSARMRSYAVC